MSQACRPLAVASLALERGTHHSYCDKGPARSHFTLSAAGPFCPWPKISKQANLYYRAEQLINQISALLALPARCAIRGNVLDLFVVVSDEEWQKIFEREYGKVTRQ